MTRLNRQHVHDTRRQLKDIDAVLQACAHRTLREVALETIGCGGSGDAPAKGIRVATVPITSGQGIITDFSETVGAIATHVGLNARTTRRTDVAGIAEAYATASEIIIMADDHRFVAINTQRRSVIDNNRATGESFAVLLSLMAGGVSGKTCGVIGCGPVGTAAALRLGAMGASVTLCDIDAKRAQRLSSHLERFYGTQAPTVSQAGSLLKDVALIVDASPAEMIIDESMIKPETMIVAPGVPHGLTPEAKAIIGGRLYHDNLPLGAATMALAASLNRLTTDMNPDKQAG